MPFFARLLAGAAPLALAATAVHADVVISSAATENITCSAGVCAPTATDAVLNAGDLENMLAAGDITVTTTGSGVQAKNIDVTAPFSWTAANALALDSYRSITFSAEVGDSGTGSFSSVTNHGGSGGMFQFVAGGNISFSNLADTLTINGTKYELENNIKSLASDILDHPSGSFALANDIDAKTHGIYRTPPIPVDFAGSFAGLGHVISNLQIGDQTGEPVGLFANIMTQATVSGLRLKNIHIDAAGGAGGVAGGSGGTIFNTWVTGKITAGGGGGGLVGGNSGTISAAWSAVGITSQSGNAAGGLAGTNNGFIETSFATGNVSGMQAGINGGLVGLDYGPIGDSYATGKVTAPGGMIGGAIGYLVTSNIDSTYEIGHVGSGAFWGGFIGYDYSNYHVSSCYWDSSTNKNATGVGNGGGTGIRGLTTRKLQSGLPKGFKPTIWAEDPDINNGFPYLIANPPPN